MISAARIEKQPLTRHLNACPSSAPSPANILARAYAPFMVELFTVGFFVRSPGSSGPARAVASLRLPTPVRLNERWQGLPYPRPEPPKCDHFEIATFAINKHGSCRTVSASPQLHVKATRRQLPARGFDMGSNNGITLAGEARITPLSLPRTGRARLQASSATRHSLGGGDPAPLALW